MVWVLSVLSLRVHLPTALEQWLTGLGLILALGVTLLESSRRLPLQNVIVIGALIGLAAWAGRAILRVAVALAGVSLRTSETRIELPGVSWIVPVLWIVFVLNSREVARLILQPWRGNRNYGFMLIGLAALLAVVLDLGFESFAFGMGSFGTWPLLDPQAGGFLMPWGLLASDLLLALLLLFITLPWYLDKREVEEPKPGSPLGVWAAVALYFTFGNAFAGAWLAAAASAASLFAVIWAARPALRGTRDLEASGK